MAWNEPGNGGKDPWGRGNGGQGAPDLEELFKKFMSRFGGSGGGNGGGFSVGILIIAIVIVLLWLLSGFYKVDTAEKAAVLRFGKLTHVAAPGLHWHIPYPVESVETVNVDRIRSFPYSANMLTSDENIVHIELDVLYTVKNVGNYLFRISDPNRTLGEAAKSAIRQVVGSTEIDSILGGKGREKLAERTKKLLQGFLNHYHSGLRVTTVNITSAQPPDEVQAAYTDVIEAHQKKQQLINKAKAYRNKILTLAKGTAAQKIARARGYAKKTVQQAKGRASRFNQLVKAYHQAPEVTRKRLYLDTMQHILGQSSKVLLDVDGSTPLLYLPLNKMMKAGGTAGAAQKKADSSQNGQEKSGTQSGQSGSSLTRSRSRSTSILGRRGRLR